MEVGHRGGNLVEFFELHEIDPRPNFRSLGPEPSPHASWAWGCAIHAI